MNDQDKAKARLEAINAKRAVKHPQYDYPLVDMRTQAEVEESRNLNMKSPIFRLHRSAVRQGRAFVVRPDLDGAYRVGSRLDESKAISSLK